MAENNNKTLAFYERIKSIIPLKENGEVDVDKFRELLLNGDPNNPDLKYLYSKIPEFFARGSEMFGPLYDICQTRKNDGVSNENRLLVKISNGDLSDIKQFEEMYQDVQKLAKYLSERIGPLSFKLNNNLWDKKEACPDSWSEELNKYPEIYELIINNGGMLEYNGKTIDASQIDNLIEQDVEGKEMLMFARKVARCYEMCQEGKIFKFADKKYFNDNIAMRQRSYNDLTNSLNGINADLQSVNNRLKSFNFITSITKKSEKQELLKRQAELVAKAKSITRSIETSKNALRELEEEREFTDYYIAKYTAKAQSHIIPLVYKNVEKKFSPEEQLRLKPLIDNMFGNLLSEEEIAKRKEDPLVALDNELTGVKDVPFERYADRFNNALYTMTKGFDTVIAFENAEHKDLNALLRIIRTGLNDIPTDSDHDQKLSTEFRTSEISATSDFMDHAANHTDIERIMGILNEDFSNLMNVEKTDDYIKQAGTLYYRFMLCHPYSDGNGRTGISLLNTLLAHKGIALKAIYSSREEQYNFNKSMDKHVIKRKEGPDFDGLGRTFLKHIKTKAIDISGEDRQIDNKEVQVDEDMEF